MGLMGVVRDKGARGRGPSATAQPERRFAALRPASGTTRQEGPKISPGCDRGYGGPRSGQVWKGRRHGARPCPRALLRPTITAAKSLRRASTRIRHDRPPPDRLPLLPAWGVLLGHSKYFDKPRRVRLLWSRKHQGRLRDCTHREQTVTHQGPRRTGQTPPVLIQDECEIRPFTEEPPVAQRSRQKYTPFTGWQ
jgi:hypothetical protein